MEKGSDEREIPDFVAGASAFHLEKFGEAESILEEYFETYPDGQRLEPAQFYLGSAKVRLSKWEDAAEMLDDFLKTYPNSEMRPPALFLSGLSHQVLEEPEVALKRVDELQQKFSGAPEIPASHNLKGDILAGGEADHETILAEYGKAKEMFEKENRGDTDVAAYATQQLVATAGKAQAAEMAAGFYDDFKEKYWDTSYRLDTTLAAVNPLIEVGRIDEIRRQMLDFVNETVETGTPDEIDLIFGTCLDFLDKNFTAEEKLTQLKEFPYQDPNNPNPTLRSWILMAQIEALEGSGKPGQHRKEIDQHFYALNAIYENSGLELSSYILVRLARWNWQKREKAEEAKEVYEFILTDRNATGDSLGFALVDMGKLEMETKDEGSIDRAFQRFGRVLEEV
jgi:tetratricopeptide (TPR) repeat protein